MNTPSPLPLQKGARARPKRNPAPGKPSGWYEWSDAQLLRQKPGRFEPGFERAERQINQRPAHLYKTSYANVQGLRAWGGRPTPMLQRIVDAGPVRTPRGTSIVGAGPGGKAGKPARCCGAGGTGLVFAVLAGLSLVVVNFSRWLDPFIILTAPYRARVPASLDASLPPGNDRSVCGHDWGHISASGVRPRPTASSWSPSLKRPSDQAGLRTAS